MEMIILDKFLLRTDDYNYILSKKHKGKKAIIKTTDEGKKDYGNFDTRNSTYHKDLYSVLRNVKEAYIRESNVSNLNELFDLLSEIKLLLETLKEKLDLI